MDTLALVGRFRAVVLEDGAQLETGAAGFLHIYAAECIVPVPNPNGEITFRGPVAPVGVAA
jgi:hypothetical protein